MKSQALLIAAVGIIISYLAFIEGHSDIGATMSSSVLSGFYGYLQKKKSDKSSPETYLTLFIFCLCVFSFFFSPDSFLSISSVLNSAISGYFGVSIGAKFMTENRSLPPSYRE